MMLLVRITLLLVLLPACSRALAEGVTPFADVLLWHASQQTSSVWSSAITTSEAYDTFSSENVDFGWDPGFRVGFAHDPGELSWDTKLYWTRFRTAAEASLPPGSGTIAPEFFSGFVNVTAGKIEEAALRWDLMLNTIDFDVGRTITVGESVSLRPSMGLKAAFIRQKIRANWNSTSGSLSATERIDHDFRGLGPAFGIDGRWKPSRLANLSVVGTFSGALLWGVWNVDDAYERNDAEFPFLAYGALTTSMNDSSLGTVNLNYFLGLEWFRPGTITMTGRIGYELQWWANQQRLPTFQQLPMHGDLTVQGLTCGISVGF